MPPSFDPRPVTLEGARARLEPLTAEHAGDLLEAGRDPSIWTYMPMTGFTDLDAVRGWIEAAQRGPFGEAQVPFAIVDRATGRAVGSTRFLDVRPPQRTLEIGWTWLTPAAQRTAINTECKLLLMTHAFETLGARRVQLKTDRRNVRSRRAILRIGAVEEGTLRRQMLMPDGHERDSVFFSVIAREWPVVKRRLETMAGAG